MLSRFGWGCACLAALAVPVLAGEGARVSDERLSVSKKGSVLIFCAVEVKYDAQGSVLQDTFLELTNDYNASVKVQLYFVNGDAASPTEPGWNWVDNEITLTHDEPAYWAASSGLPKGTSPWSILDPGPPPGRVDPDDPNLRALRGFVIAWAVDGAGAEIRWNHLTGKAVSVNYSRGSAWEYPPYAFQALGTDHGMKTGTSGVLNFDGIEFDLGFDKLLIDFYAVGSFALSGGNRVISLDTDLTLLPISTDLRQDNDGPVTTKAKFDIWNMNEVRFSGTDRCVTCWDQTLLSRYKAPNHLLLENLQTDKGKARIDGVASSVCPPNPNPSAPASLLGVYERVLSFVDGTQASAGGPLVGQGTESATVKYDLIAAGGELRGRLDDRGRGGSGTTGTRP